MWEHPARRSSLVFRNGLSPEPRRGPRPAHRFGEDSAPVINLGRCRPTCDEFCSTGNPAELLVALSRSAYFGAAVPWRLGRDTIIANWHHSVGSNCREVSFDRCWPFDVAAACRLDLPEVGRQHDSDTDRCFNWPSGRRWRGSRLFPRVHRRFTFISRRLVWARDWHFEHDRRRDRQ